MLPRQMVIPARAHDRISVLLDVGDLEIWLSGAPSAELFVPTPEATLQIWVSRRLNRVSGDSDPELIDAIT